MCFLLTSGRSGVVAARLPAAREVLWLSDLRWRQVFVFFFHENHCDTQLWARAAHLLQTGRLSLSHSEGR